MLYSSVLGGGFLKRVREIADVLFSNNPQLAHSFETAMILGCDGTLQSMLAQIEAMQYARMMSDVFSYSCLAKPQANYPDDEIEAALIEWAKSKNPKPREIKPLPPMNARALLVKAGSYHAMPEAAPTPDEPKPLKSLSQMQPQPDPQRPLALPESKEIRQAKRWALCVDAGLRMPSDTYSPLPRGVGAIADSLGISRQAFSQDLKAHAERIFGK